MKDIDAGLSIVMVSPRCFPIYSGGVEKFVYLLSKELIKRGFKIRIFGTEPRLKSPSAKISVNGIEAILFRSYAPKETIYYSPALLTALKKVDANIIHAHGYRALTMLESALVKSEKKKLVITTHLGFSKIGRWLYKLYNPIIGRAIFQKADKIVLVSPSELYEISELKMFKHKIVYIPIGITLPSDEVNCKKFLKEKIEIIYVGRIEKKKGVSELLKLARVLDKERFHLTIVGSGPYEGTLINLISHLRLTNVSFLGKVSEDELRRLYAKSSIFLLLSEYEGHSVALTEAMSYGLIPIATNVGGNKYVVGDAGFLVRYPCNINEVLELLYNLYDDRKELLTKALKARTRAQRLFDINKIADRYVEIYGDFLS